MMTNQERAEGIVDLVEGKVPHDAMVVKMIEAVLCEVVAKAARDERIYWQEFIRINFMDGSK